MTKADTSHQLFKDLRPHTNQNTNRKLSKQIEFRINIHFANVLIWWKIIPNFLMHKFTMCIETTYNTPGARPVIRNSTRICSALVSNMLNRSQRNLLCTCSRQCNGREVCIISLWSAEFVMNKSTTNFLLNFEFDRNIVSGTGAWNVFESPVLKWCNLYTPIQSHCTNLLQYTVL